MDGFKKKLLLILGPSIASGFLLLFTVFIAVFIVLGIFDGNGSSNNSDGGSSQNNDIVYISGSGEVLYDGSYTKATFVDLIKNYNAPSGKASTGRAYRWGYETFFIANAENFFDISVKYGMDPRFIFCIGIHESGWGTSNIANNKGNFFGWGAYDSSPYDSALSFYDMSDGIETVAKGLANNYVKEGASVNKTIKGKGLDPTTIDGIGSSYASDKNWPNAVRSYIQKIFGETLSTTSNNGNVVLLDNYPLKGGNTTALNSKLSNDQLSTISNNVSSSVGAVGHNNTGVVAAAQSLIMSLYNMGYRLPYYFGGGHYRGLATGADSLWGTTVGGDRKGRTIYSYDCSGFVSWSIKNGCKANFSADSSSGFLKNYGKAISISSSKPGDLMVRDGHVRLIIKNNGDGSIITAESTSGYGIVFNSYSSTTGGYSIIDMSSWYSSNCDK